MGWASTFARQTHHLPASGPFCRALGLEWKCFDRCAFGQGMTEVRYLDCLMWEPPCLGRWSTPCRGNRDIPNLTPNGKLDQLWRKKTTCRLCNPLPYNFPPFLETTVPSYPRADPPCRNAFPLTCLSTRVLSGGMRDPRLYLSFAAAVSDLLALG